MPRIFISYRRQDSQHITDRIYEHMINHFDEDSVFQDVDQIPFGVDFREYLQEQIQKADAVLVIVGPDWVRIMQERAEHANDFVRIEIESALRHDKLVIPVLVKGAAMPSSNMVPESIKEFCYRNAAPVRPNPDFRRDCQVLADDIKEHLATTQAMPDVVRNDILPEPFAWCEIPAGKVTIIGVDGSYIPEGETRTFDVPHFYMAKYPITNAQYARFIEAGGYDERKWWTDIGWQICEDEGWTQPAYWHDPRWNGTDHPVVGVSIHEATAFTRWLSDLTGATITLPTEQQWQRAAQGDDGRKYPYGNTFDMHKANTRENGVRHTTSVTAYPDGASPYGVMDMSGNVIECCTTAWKSGADDQNGEEPLHVLRGGSFVNPDFEVKTTTRLNNDPPGGRYHDDGFRVCSRLSK